MAAASGKWHVAIALLAIAALAAPRLITAAPLDLLATTGPSDDPAERADDNFPGSAYFYVQGAFEPAPGLSDQDSQHVMALDTVQPAPAMAFRGLTPLDSYRAVNCLTTAIYYEAGNEPDEGQRAVAQVVLNRVRHPLWPNSVCGVVYQGSERTDDRCQFTFSCDGSMARIASTQGWARARRVAEQALSGIVYKPVGLATYYHTLAVRPGWAAAMRPVAVVGAHIFYRPQGTDGTPSAFRVAYLGRESQSGPSRPSYAPSYGPPLPLAIPMIQPAEPVAPPVQTEADGRLPQSSVRPEYRNSGRPLI